MLADYTLVNMVERVTVFKHMVGCIVFTARKEKLLWEQRGVCRVSTGLPRRMATRTHFMVVNQPRGEDGVITRQQRLGALEKGRVKHT